VCYRIGTHLMYDFPTFEDCLNVIVFVSNTKYATISSFIVMVKGLSFRHRDNFLYACAHMLSSLYVLVRLISAHKTIIYNHLLYPKLGFDVTIAPDFNSSAFKLRPNKRILRPLLVSN
jgi:hypothetical protein